MAFFGLTQDYRVQLFQQLHEIVFYSNGGYNWGTVYNFPIWLRKYTFNVIKEHYEKEKEKYSKSKKSKETFGPDIRTSYSTKASTK